jgi:hypothetical protein
MGAFDIKDKFIGIKGFPSFFRWVGLCVIGYMKGQIVTKWLQSPPLGGHRISVFMV